jgi:hypothetical protein
MMKIRVGFEMIYDCPQPTPMIFNLNVHFTRVSDLVGRDDLVFDPPVPTSGYRDGFGNWCTRIVAPTGRLRVAAATPSLSAGAHRLSFRNGHHPDIGVYLANALVPADDRVAVTGQQRDVDQRELVIAFELRADQPDAVRWWMLRGAGVLLALLGCVWRYRRSP